MSAENLNGSRNQRGSDLDRWEAQLRKGCLEMAILAALAPGRNYGLEIIRALERYSDLIVSEGTVYPILNRLREDRLLTSSWVESETGHPRKYYSLTRLGYERATRMAEVWMQFTSGVNTLIRPLLPEQMEKVR